MFRSILVQEGMKNEVGSVLGEHDAGWSTPSSPTRVAEPRRASTRDEWRRIVNPRARREEARRHLDAGWSDAGSLTRVVEERQSMESRGMEHTESPTRAQDERAASTV